jgi:hypothetical protein
MKTHAVAHFLQELAEALLECPDVEIKSIRDFIKREPVRLQANEIKIGLSHLVALSRVDRRQWMSLIDEYRFPIDVRSRDASRDILGKLLRYLEQNAEARERLSRGTSAESGKASPELLRALKVLLRE